VHFVKIAQTYVFGGDIERIRDDEDSSRVRPFMAL